ncbi:MAG: undecaprenyl/decaprenyl-phosphate alpha-N-acetylglucosaminyl 1-phosphate transferase [Pleurocapsa minor GSE-CHR-MK-17-07R]|jgi:UDP-GlcNAc:undecaprenyl-phosphate GlcNAc-1-phosphate transferase|nr:undecaprenyl/decaprenyl-phosphate alpha-N-acetylglucosaminyl 1-phosphate transferase [Pleurocapsa minor GSE-CHR-MK 17-07R]
MDALQWVPVLVVGFAASLGLTPLSRAIALRLGVVAIPSGRNIHKDYKPLMGGLAMFLAFALALLLFSDGSVMTELLVVIGGALFLAIVGLVDDRYNLGIRIRLLAQALTALVVAMLGVRIQLFNFPLVDIPLTVFWVCAITNAINFLDNMDGLAAGLTGIAAAGFTLIAFTEGLELVSMLAAALAGAAIGFLIYNFNPASSFMGDMGSLVLGFVLSALAIKLEFGVQPLSVTWMVPLLVLALPVIDINLILITRYLEKRPLGQGGKDHSSHRLMAMGLSQRQTLGVLYAFCALYAGLGYVVSTAPPATALIVGLLGLAGMAGFFGFLFWARIRYQRPLRQTSP